MRSRPSRTGSIASPCPAAPSSIGLHPAHRDIDRPHFDTMLARIAHQLRWRVEAERLAVQQRGEKGIRVVALQPAAEVGELSEAGRMALGEAVLAEALHLLEDVLGELGVVALLDHPADEPVVKVLEPAMALPRRHRAPQLIGLAGREIGGDHRDLHHLLLEDRHAVGALQGVLQRRRVVDLLACAGSARGSSGRDAPCPHGSARGARSRPRRRGRSRSAASGAAACSSARGSRSGTRRRCRHGRSSRRSRGPRAAAPASRPAHRGPAWRRRTRARGGSRSACRARGCRP